MVTNPYASVYTSPSFSQQQPQPQQQPQQPQQPGYGYPGMQGQFATSNR
jgi:hypothetical protein